MCRSMNMYTLIKFPPWVGKAPWRLARLWSQVQNSNLRQSNTFKVRTSAQVPCPPASMNFLTIHQWKALPTMDMSTGEPAALKANSHLLATCSMASDTNRPEAGMICSHISLWSCLPTTSQPLCLWPGPLQVPRHWPMGLRGLPSVPALLQSTLTANSSGCCKHRS